MARRGIAAPRVTPAETHGSRWCPADRHARRDRRARTAARAPPRPRPRLAALWPPDENWPWAARAGGARPLPAVAARAAAARRRHPLGTRRAPRSVLPPRAATLPPRAAGVPGSSPCSRSTTSCSSDGRSSTSSAPATLAAALAGARRRARAAPARGRPSWAAAPAARETRARRRAVAVALAVAVIGGLAAAGAHDRSRTPRSRPLDWSLDEAFAVLNGRTPLVDFHPQYGQLLPYLAASRWRSFGSHGARLHDSSCAAQRAALARGLRAPAARRAQLAARARAVRAVPGGPPSARPRRPDGADRVWPMRYGGPYLLAWLTARHLDGAAPRARVAAVPRRRPRHPQQPRVRRRRRSARRSRRCCARAAARARRCCALAIDASPAACSAALALVALLTLVRAGALPQLRRCCSSSRRSSRARLVLVPMPTRGPAPRHLRHVRRRRSRSRRCARAARDTPADRHARVERRLRAARRQLLRRPLGPRSSSSRCSPPGPSRSAADDRSVRAWRARDWRQPTLAHLLGAVRLRACRSARFVRPPLPSPARSSA